MVLQLAKAEKYIMEAGLVITGEGKIDEQTLHGKLVSSIASLSKQHGKPLMAFCGMLAISNEALEDIGITSAFPIVDGPMDLQEAIRNGASLLQEKAYQVAKVLDASLF